MRRPLAAILVGTSLAFLAVGELSARLPSWSSPPPTPAARPDDANAPAYREVGKASWYGPRLHGRRTASGERFDQNKLTAAHRKLPLGTRAVVTNLENGKTVKVEINDRGPHKRGRVLDLSKAAARRLGMVDDGVVRVRIEVL
jgi:rare lipoprotein A